MAINHPYEIPGVIAVWHAANAGDIDTAEYDIPDGVLAWRRMRNPDNPGDTSTTYDNTIWNAATNDYRPEFAAGKNLVNGVINKQVNAVLFDKIPKPTVCLPGHFSGV